MIIFICEEISYLPDGSYCGRSYKSFIDTKELESWLKENENQNSYNQRSLIGYEIAENNNGID